MFLNKSLHRDSGPFIVVFAEYQNEELEVSSSRIVIEYHHLRCTSLLWNYGVDKAEKRYFSDNEDPSCPKPNFKRSVTEDVVSVK